MKTIGKSSYSFRMDLIRLRVRIPHTRFCIAYPSALFVICNAINIGTLAKWFRQGDGLDYLALGAYLLAGLSLFIVVFTLLAHRWTIKPLAILLTITSAAATYFISKYGVAVDSSMVQNTIHTDPTEVRQLLSLQMIPYGVFLILAPVLLILTAEISFQSLGRYLLGSAKLIGIALCIALASLYVQYKPILRAGNVSNKYIVYSLVPVNIIASSVSVVTQAVRPYFRKHQKEPELAAKVTKPANLVVVLAIGESSRRKNFSLYGYARRNTNPELQKLAGLHLLDAVATRGSTLYALPMILQKKGIKLTSVTSRAGIPTTCLVNFTLYENCSAVGELKPHDCAHDGKCYDEDVVPLLKANLENYSSGERFVVLHFGGGSHGPLYVDRYPAEFQRFKPMCTDADVAGKCSLEELYNSYDNTILYVDYVLGRTIQTLDESRVPYVFIYLSDHGESLLENGMMFHGVPPGVALPAEQADIPLIVKSSMPISIKQRASYQQGDVYDSVLNLLSVESPQLDRAGSFILTHDRGSD
jgi:lipid A ethanolaminephosphotransferase